MSATHLICTACKKEHPINTTMARCTVCGEPLEVSLFSRGTIQEGDCGNPSLRERFQTILERYKNFFPFPQIDKTISLNEGFTPLIRSSRLTELMDLDQLYFKNESVNPTWSFKDRGTVSGIQHAMQLGIKKIGTVSTGNMAVSVAAYGARAELKTYILVSDNIPPEKLAPIMIYNPTLIRVAGDYSDLYFLSLDIGLEKGIYFINSDVPLRVEGSKTIAFEICEQLDFQAPDFVIVPTSAGGNLRGILKGFEEFLASGLISALPRIVCAQALGCAPIFNAMQKNLQNISRVENPETVAHAIANPFPPSGNQVLRKLRATGGLSVAVSEDEIIQAQKQLALEGIFGQPAAAVPLAAVAQLRKNNTIKKSDRVVCIVSGSGLKFTAVLSRHKLTYHDCAIQNLQTFFENER